MTQIKDLSVPDSTYVGYSQQNKQKSNQLCAVEQLNWLLKLREKNDP